MVYSEHHMIVCLCIVLYEWKFANIYN